uniref:Probable pectate lyase F n=1 Tax=Ditylenchus dipsaci TaxID=166011 RepID=A0A915DN65_9BILA
MIIVCENFAALRPLASCYWKYNGQCHDFRQCQQVFDCKLTRYIPNPTTLGDGSQKEKQRLSGTEGSADGVHCMGYGCTLDNVWFEDVGEDAITLMVGLFYNINNCGARNAVDKMIQFDGKGTAKITNFYADTFARFARCCGNCATTTITGLKLGGASAHKVNACKKFVGVTSGEPKSNGMMLTGSIAFMTLLISLI